MFKCANCSADAKYTHRVNDAIAVHYCEKHVPNLLQGKKRAGLLPLMVVASEPEKAPKKKKEEPVVEEAVAEESEEAPVEEPTDADN